MEPRVRLGREERTDDEGLAILTALGALVAGCDPMMGGGTGAMTVAD